MEKMKCELGRLKARGEEERHALAKPRLVAVLRSKLRFTCFLLSTDGLTLSFFLPPTLQADLPYSAFPLSLFSAFPKCCLAHIGFLPSPLLRAVSFPLFISLS